MGVRRMLTEVDREEISRGIAEQAEGRVIAERIGRDPSVVCRDIAGHGGRARYRATVAGCAAAVCRSRSRIRKLDADPGLRERVLEKLRAGCSPDQVAGRLRHEHGGDHAERVADTVSHEGDLHVDLRASEGGARAGGGSCCARGG
ncbi:MAG: transposase [Pseudonocardia sp.]